MTFREPTSLLRGALLGNAMFSTASGASLVLASASLAAWLGVASPGLLVAIGAGLLLFAARLIQVALRKPHPRVRDAWAIVVADVAWVLGSAALLLLAPSVLSPSGRWAVTAVAFVVAVLASAQALGAWRVGVSSRLPNASRP